jgi:carbamoyltransferase
MSCEEIAAAFQNRLEEVMCQFVSRACRDTRISNLIVSGGVAANVKMNQKLHELPELDNISVSPAMGDVGLPLGAALYAAHISGMPGILDSCQHVFLGPEYTNTEITGPLRHLDNNLITGNIDSETIAKLLADGNIVALFHGKLEYGPRALGSRSVLCRPDDISLIQRLSRDLDRPYFMPFAPSVLARLASRCFINLKGAEQTARFMNISFQATPWFKSIAPSVVHVDGSVRPSLVDETNPVLLDILEKFHALTGVPCILNTSFNRHGEPIVCSPQDALKTFLSTRVDYLAIGSFLVTNPHPETEKTGSSQLNIYQ